MSIVTGKKLTVENMDELEQMNALTEALGQASLFAPRTLLRKLLSFVFQLQMGPNNSSHFPPSRRVVARSRRTRCTR